MKKTKTFQADGFGDSRSEYIWVKGRLLKIFKNENLSKMKLFFNSTLDPKLFSMIFIFFYYIFILFEYL